MIEIDCLTARDREHGGRGQGLRDHVMRIFGVSADEPEWDFGLEPRVDHGVVMLRAYLETGRWGGISARDVEAAAAWATSRGGHGMGPVPLSWECGAEECLGDRWGRGEEVPEVFLGLNWLVTERLAWHREIGIRASARWNCRDGGPRAIADEHRAGIQARRLRGLRGQPWRCNPHE